ncbi:SDR family NAD(P)-dependent oxidoreductase [Erwinia sp. CPCC 100877]|nr:SDR family NAD(P)-dependent oxidoreductase [Erwinia sp. CPCC 100877]
MKYITITGASSGIGLETARFFAEMGKNLILVARRQEKLVELKEELLTKHPSIDIIVKKTDLSDKTEVLTLYTSLKKYDIEVWINNAGFGYYHHVRDQDLQIVSDLIHLNVEAISLLSTLYVSEYADRKAQLINVSSAGGYQNVTNAVSYCATKFYVSAFTEGLALELKASNLPLQAKVLAPAATQTEFAKIANHLENYDYSKGFSTYHTAKEIAQFLIELYESDQIVGLVDRNTFSFVLSDPIFPHTYKSN